MTGAAYSSSAVHREVDGPRCLNRPLRLLEQPIPTCVCWLAALPRVRMAESISCPGPSLFLLAPARRHSRSSRAVSAWRLKECPGRVSSARLSEPVAPRTTCWRPAVACTPNLVEPAPDLLRAAAREQPIVCLIDHVDAGAAGSARRIEFHACCGGPRGWPMSPVSRSRSRRAPGAKDEADVQRVTRRLEERALAQAALARTFQHERARRSYWSRRHGRTSRSVLGDLGPAGTHHKCLAQLGGLRLGPSGSRRRSVGIHHSRRSGRSRVGEQCAEIPTRTGPRNGGRECAGTACRHPPLCGA